MQLTTWTPGSIRNCRHPSPRRRSFEAPNGTGTTAGGETTDMSRRRKKYVVVSNDGPPCPRCWRPMEVREHDQIQPKHLRQPYYYSRWYNCRHRDCKTTLCMSDEFKIWNDEQEGEQ